MYKVSAKREAIVIRGSNQHAPMRHAPMKLNRSSVQLLSYRSNRVVQFINIGISFRLIHICSTWPLCVTSAEALVIFANFKIVLHIRILLYVQCTYIECTVKYFMSCNFHFDVAHFSRFLRRFAIPIPKIQLAGFLKHALHILRGSLQVPEECSSEYSHVLQAAPKNIL